jgi:hypothetical protein
MRKCANISPIYEEAVSIIYDLQLLHSKFPYYEENLLFFFISVDGRMELQL